VAANDDEVEKAEVVPTIFVALDRRGWIAAGLCKQRQHIDDILMVSESNGLAVVLHYNLRSSFNVNVENTWKSFRPLNPEPEKKVHEFEVQLWPTFLQAQIHTTLFFVGYIC